MKMMKMIKSVAKMRRFDRLNIVSFFVLLIEDLQRA